MSLIVSTVAASTAIAFPDLGLSPVAIDLGFFQLRWYSLAYLAGILLVPIRHRRYARQATHAAADQRAIFGEQ